MPKVVKAYSAFYNSRHNNIQILNFNLRLEESEVLSTRAMKKLSEKQKLIQEQSEVIVEKEKERKENMTAVKALKEEKSVNKSMSFII